MGTGVSKSSLFTGLTCHLQPFSSFSKWNYPLGDEVTACSSETSLQDFPATSVAVSGKSLISSLTPASPWPLGCTVPTVRLKQLLSGSGSGCFHSKPNTHFQLQNNSSCHSFVHLQPEACCTATRSRRSKVENRGPRHHLVHKNANKAA